MLNSSQMNDFESFFEEKQGMAVPTKNKPVMSDTRRNRVLSRLQYATDEKDIEAVYRDLLLRMLSHQTMVVLVTVLCLL